MLLECSYPATWEKINHLNFHRYQGGKEIRIVILDTVITLEKVLNRVHVILSFKRYLQLPGLMIRQYFNQEKRFIRSIDSQFVLLTVKIGQSNLNQKNIHST